MGHAFVTGGTGFIGVNLVEALLRAGWRVTALHRPGSRLDDLRRFEVETVVGSIDDLDSLRRAMPAEVDGVFHVAASTNMWARNNDAQTRDNVEGTRNVVTVALENRVGRLVHTSSIAAYGIHRTVIDEDTPQTGARSWINYLRTKALAEQEVRAGIERGLDAVIVNPANVLGPYDRRSLSTLIYLVDRGRLHVVPPGRASFCHVREVAEAHVAAYLKGRTGANYLLGGADATYLETVGIIGELTGRKVPRRATPPWILRVLARLAVWSFFVTGRRPALTPESAALTSASILCRPDRAIAELGYGPVRLRTMLEDCHRWMKTAGRLAS